MSELEKLGYVKQSITKPFTYTEWNNIKSNVRISWNGKTIYIRQITNKRPIDVYPKELMALLIDLNMAELVK